VFNLAALLACPLEQGLIVTKNDCPIYRTSQTLKQEKRRAHQSIILSANKACRDRQMGRILVIGNRGFTDASSKE
jgi:hypothetical protein